MDPESSETTDPESSELVKVAALGRPFRLGMLYDCRSDQLVPGYTLWGTDNLQKGTRKSPQHSTEFDIVASESIEEKTKSLNVEASLKASFLGGLINLEGSAKYLNESKTSQNQARVTMNYKTTTEFRQLSMNTLGNVKYPDVFDSNIATHVVTGIVYGAQAFFVFDREVSNEENRQIIEGSTKAVINKFRSIRISGEVSVKLDDEDKNAVDKFSCKFIGDFQLKSNPVTFKDAIETYRSLSELLGKNEEKAVPMTVWLMPLTSLDSKAAKLVREISIGLVNDAQSVLEDFSELELRYNDALKSTVAHQFPQISKKLNTFKSLCNEYKLGFQKSLADILPSIRGGGEEESVLAEILKRRHSSLFNIKDLNEWMDGKEREINVVNSFTDMLKNTKVVTNQSQFDKIILSPTTESAYCFAFTALEIAEPYLLALSSYLDETPKPPKVDCQDVEEVPWYYSAEVFQSMRQKATFFNDFSVALLANDDKKNLQFLITATTNKKQKGASVYHYKNGFLESDDFQLPSRSQLLSKPETPEAIDITHNSVTLKMVPPRSGAQGFSHYSIEYCVAGQKEPHWQLTVPKAQEVTTVSNLTVHEKYTFRYRAVYPNGNGPASDAMEMKTLPTNPPEIKICQWFQEPNQVVVYWNEPTEIG